MHSQKNKVYIIAEAGVNHNGSIDSALEMVNVAKKCGADAIKFQTFKTELNVSKHSKLAEYQENANINASGQLEMLKKLELSREDFVLIKKKCDECNIDFISTPDDEWSIQLLLELNVKYIKIASAEIDNLPFLRTVGQTKKTIILSTGMSTLGEVERAINALKESGAQDIILLHCTSNYPTNPSDVNLLSMKTLAFAFQLKVGYSDHTLGWDAAIIATTLGAEIIEKHFTLDKTLPGPDHQASADPNEFSQYVKIIRKTELMLGDGIKRPQINEHSMRSSMRRSLVAAANLKKGEILKIDHINFKRPGTGISPSHIDLVLGKKLFCDIDEDDLISWEALQ